MQIINGALKNYAWGIPRGLDQWIGATVSARVQPQAELWFGVHPNGASTVADSGVALDRILGRADVPILVKILAAAKPLSVQVHPNSALAQEGFNTLNNTVQFAGAFADPYEKIELLYALTPFTAFCGWRPVEQVRQVFDALGIDGPAEVSSESGVSRQDLFVYCVNHEVAPDTLGRIPSAIRAAGLSQLEISSYERVVSDYPGDQGALLAVFLQPISLAPGESVYIPSGVPHSYIAGTGIEVMTSSDNVLRLGLTPKPVYPELALRALDFDASRSRSTDAPFSVEVINADSDVASRVELPSGQFRVVLCLDGKTHVASTELSCGQAAVITATEPAISLSTTGSYAIIRTEL
ncbi:MAG: mannose-6-phosphate isomerase, class I [Candidatus Nanopelagicales bacterium]|nr:mannose-6-phosphate isomerase, class I [Candidatus Nanopelagicales bacterium]